MRRLDIVRRSGRSLLSARARTLLTAFAIAVGAFALSLTLAASNGAQNYADSIVRDNFDPSELIVSASQDLFNATDTSKPREYNANFSAVTLGSGAVSQVETLDDQDIATLRSVPGVNSVRTGETVNVQYITRDGMRKYVATGQAFSGYRTPQLRAGTGDPKVGQLVLPEGYLQDLGFSDAQAAIGKTVRISVAAQGNQQAAIAKVLAGGSLDSLQQPGASEERDYTIVGISKKPSTLVQPGTELYLTFNAADAKSLQDYATAGTQSYHKYPSVYVKVTDGTDQAKLTAVQTAIKQRGYGAQSVVDTQKTITQVISVLQGIVSVFGLIAVVASIFGIVNTMYISVLQRTREIGLMKALGMHKRDINQLFLFEAGLIGLLGGLIGVVVATVLGTLLNPFISDKLSLGDAHLLDFHWQQSLLLVLVLTVVAIMAGVFPARKAARLDPIEALRSE